MRLWTTRRLTASRLAGKMSQPSCTRSRTTKGQHSHILTPKSSSKPLSSAGQPAEEAPAAEEQRAEEAPVAEEKPAEETPADEPVCFFT